ncbi:MAG: hypothetical protein QW716_00860 [Desulfurococcaceae archaeon]
MDDKQSQVELNKDFLKRIEYIEGFVKISRKWTMLIKGETSINDLKKTIEEAFKQREKVSVEKIKKKLAKKKVSRKKKSKSSRKSKK